MTDFKQGMHARFTVHQKGDPPTEQGMGEWIETVHIVCSSEPNIIACVIGLEKGDEGRWHGQGYMRFEKKIRLVNLRKQVNDMLSHEIEVHFCKADASPKANYGYCTKDKGDKYEFGDFPDAGQGRREDVIMLHKMVTEMAGKPNAELKCFQEHPSAMFRYFKGAERFSSLLAKQIRREVGYVRPVVKVYWGGTGLGKSRRAAFEAAELEEDVYYKGAGKFFEGFDNEKCQIWEEFRGNWCTPEEFLRMLDGYPVNVEVKGGHRIIPAGSHIWITSNTNPDHWWIRNRAERPDWDGWAAIRRRCDSIIHFIGEWLPPIVVPERVCLLGRPHDDCGAVSPVRKRLRVEIPPAPRKRARHLFKDIVANEVIHEAGVQDISSNDESDDTIQCTSENQEGENWFDI